MTKSWHHIDEIVFGPAQSPALGTTGWNQLILTPHVPSERVGVMLIVEDLTAGSNYVGFRPSDSADDLLGIGNGPHGLSTARVIGSGAPSPAAAAMIAFTGPTGIVSWVTQNAQQTRVTLAGWFDTDYEDVYIFGPDPIVPPVTWLTVPGMQDALEYTRKLAFVQVKRSIGSAGAVGFRHREPIGDPPLYFEPGTAGLAGGSTIAQNNSAQKASLVALRSGSTGLLEWQATAPPPLTTAVLTHTIRESWITYVQEVFPGDGSPDPPPTTWTTIDLSGFMGQRHVLVCLMVDHQVGPDAVANNYAFRRGDDTKEYLGGLVTTDPGGATRSALSRVKVGATSYPRRRLVWVETDDAGQIQWKASSAGFGVLLYLQGWIEGATGASISLLGAPFPPNYIMSVSLTDDDQIIEGSIYVTLISPHGIEYAVVEGGDFNASWMPGTITPNGENGFDISIDTIGTPIGLYVVGDWQMVVQADSTGGGSLITTFTIPIDTDAPTLQVFDLSQYDVVTPDDTRTLRGRITDLWGFDLDTLGLVVRPKVIKTTYLDPGKVGQEITLINGGVIQAPYTGTIRENGETMKGYDFTIRGLPDFYDPCTWDFIWTGESIVEKAFSEESLI